MLGSLLPLASPSGIPRRGDAGGGGASLGVTAVWGGNGGGGGGQAGPGRVAERCRPGWESPPPRPPAGRCRHLVRCAPAPPGSGRSGSALPRSGHGGPGAIPGWRPETQPRRCPARNTGMWSCSRVCKVLDGLVCPPSSRLCSTRPGVSPFLSAAGKLALALSPLALDFTPSEDRSRSSHPAQTSLESRGASGFGPGSVFASQGTAADRRIAEIFPSGWPKSLLRTGSGAGVVLGSPRRSRKVVSCFNVYSPYRKCHQKATSVLCG